jgi:hypothetical protein
MSAPPEDMYVCLRCGHSVLKYLSARGSCRVLHLKLVMTCWARLGSGGALTGHPFRVEGGPHCLPLQGSGCPSLDAPFVRSLGAPVAGPGSCSGSQAFAQNASAAWRQAAPSQL